MANATLVNPACLSTRRRQFCASAVSIFSFVSGASDLSSAHAISTGPPTFEKNEFVQKLLERSRANKAKYDNERLESYNRRNFVDYFESMKSNAKDKDLSETERKINAWLIKNKKK